MFSFFAKRFLEENIFLSTNDVSKYFFPCNFFVWREYFYSAKTGRGKRIKLCQTIVMSPTKFSILLTRMSPVKVLNTCGSFEMYRDVDKRYIAIIASLPTRKVAILKCCKLPCHLNHSGVSPGDHPLTKKPEDSEYEIDATQSGIRVSYLSQAQLPH